MLRRCLVLLLVLAGLAATVGAPFAQEGGDVPMFRGNAARIGEMPGPGPDPANGIQERWRFTAGDSVDSSPTVVDGVVYVGSDDGTLYALDAATGAERWRFATGDEVDSSPAVVDGVVFVGSEDGNVYALEAAEPQLEDGATAEIAGDGTDLRGGPTETAVVRADLDAGTDVTITGEAEHIAQGEFWWPVRVNDTGEVGWVNGEDLIAVFLDE